MRARVRFCFCAVSISLLRGREEVKKKIQIRGEKKKKQQSEKENANEGGVLGAVREAHRARFIVNWNVNCVHRVCKILRPFVLVSAIYARDGVNASPADFL